uniref:Uncharacterized protein n=1 Tax=Acrobeloides nanus TaxID=290746 RepID=A0A914C1V7_9BILA
MMRAEIGYIVKFEPVADASRVHHMFLYGCEVPLFNTSFWKGDGNCKEGYQYIYGTRSLRGPNLDGFLQP